jgi:tetratricopeptide (TPR) repeat protein
MGIVYSRLEDWRRAFEYFNRSLSLREATGDEAGLAITLTNIGMAYNTSGAPHDPEPYHRQALAIYEELGDRAGQAIALNNIGAVYYRSGCQWQREEAEGEAGHEWWEQALDYLQRALALREAIGDRVGSATTLYNMAHVYRAQGRLAQAAAAMERVVALDRVLEHPNLAHDQEWLAQIREEMERAAGQE